MPSRSTSGNRLPSLPLLAGALAGAASLTALAVPTIQGVVVWRTARPPVPGPHLQDGLFAGQADTKPVTLIWLGDSLASGIGAESAETSFPRKAAELACTSVSRSVHLTCLAQPGACAADVLSNQVPAAVRDLGPDAVAVVTVGSNDIGSLNSPRRFRRDYAAILDHLSATGATVIAVGLPHIGSAAVLARPLRTIVGCVGRRADRQVRRLAAAHGAHYVHIAVRAPWGTKPHTYLAADRWHPNDATYRLWADRVALRLSPLLAAQAS